MKKNALIFLIVMCSFHTVVMSQVTVGANTIPNATLDVVGSATDATKADGIIAPKLTLSQLSSKTAYGSNQIGTIVFITDATGSTNTSTVNITASGYYFYDGSVWQKMAAENTGWMLKGNSGTSASTSSIGATVNNNFIGTTDAKDMVVATNNFERLRVTSDGNVAVGTQSPAFTTTAASASKPTLGVDGTINSANYTSPVVALTDAVTITWDLSKGNNAEVSISAAGRSLKLVNLKAGMYGTLVVTQAVAGSTITSINNNGVAIVSKVINGGGGVLSFTGTVGAVDIHSFFYDGTTLYWTTGNNYN